MYTITDTDVTTHCRAGWIVTLSGVAKCLENDMSTLFIANQIYKASDPVNRVSLTAFYKDNETALADIQRMATL